MSLIAVGAWGCTGTQGPEDILCDQLSSLTVFRHSFPLTLTGGPQWETNRKNGSKFLLYYSMSAFYKNGCWLTQAKRSLSRCLIKGQDFY